jgi:hypothetical protein
MLMSTPGHTVSIVELAALALIILLVWFGLYLVVRVIIRMIRRDNSPFLKSLISPRTLAFLLFSLAIIGTACFQVYKSSIG